MRPVAILGLMAKMSQAADISGSGWFGETLS
jgi:hypothetical protein